MTPEQIKLVQDSFSRVTPISDTAAELFYARLFELRPDVRPMFPGDMTRQGEKLMATLGVVVEGLDDLPATIPVAEDLARMHVGFGVTPDHYPVVGEALLDTLAHGLGDSFSASVRDAWATAYATLSSVMISAAYPTERAM